MSKIRKEEMRRGILNLEEGATKKRSSPEEEVT